MTATTAAKAAVRTAKKPVTGTKGVAVVKSTKASEKVASSRQAKAKDTLASETKFDLVLENISLEDLQFIVEQLNHGRASYNASKYGRVYGGKAKMMAYNQALVESERAHRLLDKARKALAQARKA
jgi:hypothetical protein